MPLRARVVPLLLVCCSLFVACGGDPPETEITRAQEAIVAAEAAGASVYAREEFAAAQEALNRANDAVAQRDYRLALNHALDSLEHAQAATSQAETGRASARENAERAVSTAAMALSAASARLKSAEGARVAAKPLAEFRAHLAASEARMQEARTALERGEFTTAASAAVGAMELLQVSIADFERTTAAPPRRRR